MTASSHPALAELRQLGLITATEFDEAMDELAILALDEDDDVDMPRLAPAADSTETLAWLLHTDLLPQDAFLPRVRELPCQHGGAALLERQQLAAAALQRVNRQAVDTLYDENLINQWQRDAAHASLPADRMLSSPIDALREMVRQGSLTPPQFEALRTRQHGSRLARIIVDGAARQMRRERPAHARPGTWVMAALLLALALAITGSIHFTRRPPSPAASAGPGLERPDLRQNATHAVERGRAAGAGPALSISVVQDGATPPPAP